MILLISVNVIGVSISFLVFALLQLVCLATFLKVSENDSFDPSQVLSFDSSLHFLKPDM